MLSVHDVELEFKFVWWQHSCALESPRRIYQDLASSAKTRIMVTINMMIIVWKVEKTTNKINMSYFVEGEHLNPGLRLHKYCTL